jgi:hypothetical protein
MSNFIPLGYYKSLLFLIKVKTKNASVIIIAVFPRHESLLWQTCVFQYNHRIRFDVRVYYSLVYRRGALRRSPLDALAAE